MGKAKHPANPARPERASVLAAIADGDIQALKASLTPRQRGFAEEYVVDFNGTAAAIRAGYAKEYADRQAHQLVRHKGVMAYIEHLTRSKEAKAVSVDPDYVLQKVTEIIQKEGTKDGDRLRGLELLARHLGMFIDRQEITGKDGEALQIETKRVEEDAAVFDHLLNGLRKRAEVDKETLN